jgi:alkylhydroperoxidase family enzyme
MRDLRGRYAAFTQRLIDSVLGAPGDTSSELRRVALARAAGRVFTPWPPLRSGEGVRPESPLPQRERGSGGEDVPPALASYIDTVARHAYKLTDDDLAALQRAGNSEDAIFEITVAAALGAALGRLERGLAALRGESSPPVPLSAMRRGGTQEPL